MFIVWEKKKQAAKSHIGLTRGDGCSSGSRLASPRPGLVTASGFCSPNKGQWSVSVETVLSIANTKLAASLRGCLLLIEHWLFIYLVIWACPLAGFFGHVALVELLKFVLSWGWMVVLCFRWPLSFGAVQFHFIFGPHALLSYPRCDDNGVFAQKCFGEMLDSWSETGNYIHDSYLSLMFLESVKYIFVPYALLSDELLS